MYTKEENIAKRERVEARIPATYSLIASNLFYLYILQYQRAKLTDVIENTNYGSAYPDGLEMKKLYNAFVITFLYGIGVYFYTACVNLDMELQRAQRMDNKDDLDSAWQSFYSTFLSLSSALILVPAIFEPGEMPF